MSHKILAVISLFVILFQVKTYAQTQTATPTGEVIDQQAVLKLKEKIATKVAELRKKKKDITTGFITKIDQESFTITDPEQRKNYQVNIDESLTEVYRILTDQVKEGELKDFKEGDYVLVAGPIADNKINANAIYKDTPFQVKSGVVTEVNKEQFFLRITTLENDQYIIDIEKNTKRLFLDIDSLKLKKIGFSKIKAGDTIHFVFKYSKPEKEAKSRYSASKILIIPQEYFDKQ